MAGLRDGCGAEPSSEEVQREQPQIVGCFHGHCLGCVRATMSVCVCVSECGLCEQVWFYVSECVVWVSEWLWWVSNCVCEWVWGASGCGHYRYVVKPGSQVGKLCWYVCTMPTYVAVSSVQYSSVSVLFPWHACRCSTAGCAAVCCRGTRPLFDNW